MGQHATSHLRYDAPLTSDIEGLARPVSGWVRTSKNAQAVAADGAAAIAASRTPPGQVATLILPADAAWNPADGPAAPQTPPEPASVPAERISEIAALLRKREDTVFLIGDRIMGSERLGRLVSSIAAGAGARLIGKWYAGRVTRGAGRAVYERLFYDVDKSIEILKGTRHLVLVDAKVPVGFFAYPNKPSLLAPTDAQFHLLADVHEDVSHALEALAEELEMPEHPPKLARFERPLLPQGPLNPENVWTALTALMPENSIVSDEGVTSGRMAGPITETAPPHDWLHVTGGAIGQGLPVATGAAIANPDRQVFAMEADGSGMYTLQALWTQARESLNVVTVIFANRTYRILQYEMKNLCDKENGPHSSPMMRLDEPVLDWVSLSKGMGVPAVSVDTAEAFNAALKRGIEDAGPCLIEALV